MQHPPVPAAWDAGIPTKRLEQIPLRREHADILFPILSDIELYRFTGGDPPRSLDALRKRYEALESRRSPDGGELWLNWVIRRRERDEVVGYTQATVQGSQAYVAWVVGTRWQSRGYASEAAAGLVNRLTELLVTDIRACVHPAHGASRRVAHNAGLWRTEDTIDGEEVWKSRHPEGESEKHPAAGKR